MPTTPGSQRIMTAIDREFQYPDRLFTTVEIGSKDTDRLVEELRAKYPGFLFRVTKDSPGSRYATIRRWVDPTPPAAGDLIQAGLNVVSAAETQVRGVITAAKKKAKAKKKKK